jgi:hypothetical protein
MSIPLVADEKRGTREEQAKTKTKKKKIMVEVRNDHSDH